jgi:hypothetical protein
VGDPVEGLVAAGYALDAPAPPDDDQADKHRSTDRLTELERELADLRRRAEVAEALAYARATALDDASLDVRALTADNTPSPANGPESIEDEEAAPTPPGCPALAPTTPLVSSFRRAVRAFT